MRPVARVLAAIAMVLAVALAGCGVQGGTGPGSDAVEPAADEPGADGARPWMRRAAAQTATVSTMRLWAATEVVFGERSTAVRTEVDAGLDLGAGRARASVSIDGEGMGLSPELGTAELVVDGDALYVARPVDDPSGDAKPWVVVRSDRAPAMADLGALHLEPGAALDLLRDAGAEVAEVGTEQVRGVDTTHLAAELDVAPALGAADPSRAQELDDLLTSLGATGDDLGSIDAQVWIDDRDLVRRIRLEADRSGAGGSDGAWDIATVVTIELYDFDEPVDVAVPDPSQVSEVELPSIFGD